MIVAGSFVGVQFLKVIFQGIRASELKNTRDENEQLISDVSEKMMLMNGIRVYSWLRWNSLVLPIVRELLRNIILISILKTRIENITVYTN